jgi:signal transduction histidine kinase
MPSAAAKRLKVIATLRPVDISCDAARIQQVMWNLLGNAVKFTPPGGRIEFLVTCESDCAVIQVTDSGEGIPDHFLPHVFERFRQLDMTSTRRHEGMGLGLSIVKHVVDLHGGSVVADSRGEGQGARFTVTIPIAPAAPTPSSSPRA